jgi:hypothetical protein
LRAWIGAEFGAEHYRLRKEANVTHAVRHLPLLGQHRARPRLAGGRDKAFVVYRGPSAFDGKPIVAIVSGAGGDSSNPKTGPMAQLWILPPDVAPNEAQRTGEDASVCGDCPARPLVYRETGVARCYVTTYQGARSTWKARRDLPVDLAGCCAHLMRGRAMLRLGAFGDPAALPRRVIATLARAAVGVTGYTHAWKWSRKRWLAAYTMASVENAADAARAHARGWRTFRVRHKDTPLMPGEIVCPAAAESTATRRGLPVQCVDCRLCDGTREGTRANIAIVAH